MGTTRRILLTTLFLVFAAAGGAGLFYPELLFGDVTMLLSERTAMLLPAGLTAAYGLITAVLLRGVGESESAEHYVDSIYFLGFLFTLLALAALFFRLYGIDLTSPGSRMVQAVLPYLGAAVTSSVAGVLLRTVLQGLASAGSRQDEDELQRTYEALQATAQEFSRNSQKSFESLQTFLQERSERVSLLEQREQAYIAALEKLTASAERFSSGLSQAESETLEQISAYGRVIEQHQEQVEEIGRLDRALADLTELISRKTEELPMEEINRQLREFETGARELNDVVDSVVTLLERKVEKVS